MKNILVIKLRYIGDVILSTPVLSLLRQQFPDAHVVCLVNPGTEEVLRHNPHVDDVLVLSRGSLIKQVGFWLAVRRRRFDCVIDLTDGDRSALLTWVSGSSVRIGLNHEHRWRGRLYSQCLTFGPEGRHMVEYHTQALTLLGVHAAVHMPTVYVDTEHDLRAQAILEELGLVGQRWVMIHPTARYWFKAWPLERFARLSERLNEKSLRVVLVGDAQGHAMATAIQDRVQTSIDSLMGKTTLLELAALMQHASLFIGNDTGLMHMAAAMGCPVLGLFGPTNPQTWGPRGNNVRVIYKEFDCRACFHPGCFRGEDNCMKQISVDEVCEAAFALLQDVKCGA